MPSLLRGLRRSLLGPSDAPKGHCPICEELLQFAQAEGLTLLAHEIAMASKHAATRQCSTPCSWPRVPQQFLASKGQPDHGEWVNDGTVASGLLRTRRWKLRDHQQHGVLATAEVPKPATDAPATAAHPPSRGLRRSADEDLTPRHVWNEVLCGG